MKLEAAASPPSGLHLAKTANFELDCNRFWTEFIWFEIWFEECTLFLSSQGSHLTVTEAAPA